MHELQFARDPVSGGDFCLSIAMGTIPATAGIVHLYDIARREFLVSSAAGASVESWRHRRHPESDPVLSRAMRMRGALVIADIGAADFALPPRYTELGGVRSIVISRAALGGRFLGAIELIDPLDGLPFTATEGNALTYIAEQFAEFVASRGAVIDPAAPLGSNRGR
jgi:GAF domain-containing protein